MMYEISYTFIHIKFLIKFNKVITNKKCICILAVFLINAVVRSAENEKQKANSNQTGY